MFCGRNVARHIFKHTMIQEGQYCVRYGVASALDNSKLKSSRRTELLNNVDQSTILCQSSEVDLSMGL